VYQNNHDPKTRVVGVVHPLSCTSANEQKNTQMKDTHTHNYNPKSTETKKYYQKKPALQCYHLMLDKGIGWILSLTKSKT